MPRVTVGDLGMYYEIHGEGEPLLLIGGLSIDLTVFGRLIRALAQDYQVIAFDNRGAGRTDKPDAPYSIEQMADDTAGLLDQFHLGPAHVLGYSMGGRIAIALALRRPDLVRSLILVSTAARPSPSFAAGPLLSLTLRLPLLRTIGKKYPSPYYAVRRQREAGRRFDAVSRLPELQVPALILHGRKDTLAPLRLAQELHAGIRGSQLIVLNGGHRILFFQQQRFVAAVTAFLRALPR